MRNVAQVVWRSTALFVAAALCAVPIQAHALAFNPPGCCPTLLNGHYYEVRYVNAAQTGEVLRWEDERTFANAQTYLGLHGHLATITSCEERDALFPPGVGSPFRGMTAGRNLGGGWVWDDGPEAGQPLGPCALVNQTSGNNPDCVPAITALYASGGLYPMVSVGTYTFDPVLGGGFGYGPGGNGCGMEGYVLLEYEPDNVPPTTIIHDPPPNTIVPIGGLICISMCSPSPCTPPGCHSLALASDPAPLFIGVEAADAFGSVSSFDVQISRTGASGSYETIFSHAPPGSPLSWEVAGPTTDGVPSAFIRVVVRDDAGNEATDTTDVGFAIDAPVVPTARRSWGSLKTLYR